MRTEIKELHQRLKTTTVYVTHDQIEAMTLADLIVVLRNGRIEQIDSPLELYDTPVNVFVAGFIGSPSMNFLAGRVDAGAILLDSGERLSPSDAKLPQAGSRVVCDIRPEDFSVTASKDCALAFQVGVVEPTGSETMVIGRSADRPVTAVFRERRPLSPGELLQLQPRIVHLFDAESERRVSSAWI